VAVPRPPAPQVQSLYFAQYPAPLSFHQGENQTMRVARYKGPGVAYPAACRVTKIKKGPKLLPASLFKLNLPVRTHGRYCGRLWWPGAQTSAHTVPSVAMQC
jgi:hypothetical protein